MGAVPAELEATELEAVVTPGGDLVVPATAVRNLALVPGQRVHIRVVKTKMRNMRGILAGQIRPISAEDIAEVRRETWDESMLGPE